MRIKRTCKTVVEFGNLISSERKRFREPPPFPFYVSSRVFLRNELPFGGGRASTVNVNAASPIKIDYTLINDRAFIVGADNKEREVDVDSV